METWDPKVSRNWLALRSVSTARALSRASSDIVMVETGMRNDFIGHVIA